MLDATVEGGRERGRRGRGRRQGGGRERGSNEGEGDLPLDAGLDGRAGDGEPVFAFPC